MTGPVYYTRHMDAVPILTCCVQEDQVYHWEAITALEAAATHRVALKWVFKTTEDYTRQLAKNEKCAAVLDRLLDTWKAYRKHLTRPNDRKIRPMWQLQLLAWAIKKHQQGTLLSCLQREDERDEYSEEDPFYPAIVELLQDAATRKPSGRRGLATWMNNSLKDLCVKPEYHKVCRNHAAT